MQLRLPANKFIAMTRATVSRTAFCWVYRSFIRVSLRLLCAEKSDGHTPSSAARVTDPYYREIFALVPSIVEDPFTELRVCTMGRSEVLPSLSEVAF